MSALPITLVMPSYARPHLVRRTLPAGLRQDVAEVIVVDDGSPEPLAPVVAEAASGNASMHGDARVRVVRLEQNRGSCAARNAGVDAATQPFVLFVDDDALLGDGYARTLHDHLLAANADAAAGRRLWLRAGETPERALASRTRNVAPDALFDRRHFWFDDEACFAVDTPVPIACAIMLVKRDWLRRVRYDERRFRRSGFREETDVQVGLAAAGAKLIACPHAACFNLPKDEMGLAGGQRRGRVLRYEWEVLRNDVAFRRKHFAALSGPLRCAPGATPWLGALRHYFGFRVASKVRHLLGGSGP